MLKELLVKYSTTMEDLTAKGLNFSEISEDELEAKIVEALGIEVEPVVEPVVEEPVVEEPINEEPVIVEPVVEEPVAVVTEPVVVVEEPVAVVEEPVVVEPTVDVEALKSRIVELEGQVTELESLREFKLNVEKTDHEAKAQKMFNDFQLTVEDVEGLDVHNFSMEEIEDKCYAILGRKMAKKNFTKKEDGGIRLPLSNGKIEEEPEADSRYGNLFTKYNK